MTLFPGNCSFISLLKDAFRLYHKMKSSIRHAYCGDKFKSFGFFPSFFLPSVNEIVHRQNGTFFVKGTIHFFKKNDQKISVVFAAMRDMMSILVQYVNCESQDV